jgi:sulfur carrier protein ThiS
MGESSLRVGQRGTVMVGDQTVPWREGLTVLDIVSELGLPESYPLADVDGRFVWKREWKVTTVADRAKVRFHWVIGGG